MQTSYSQNHAVAFAGMKADSRFDHVESLQLFNSSIGLGVGLVNVYGYPEQGRTPTYNKGVLTFAGDLVASNVVNGKVGGSAISAVTYASSHAATMAAIVVAIKALTTKVLDAYLDTTDTASRTIIIKSVEGSDCVLADWAVTAGSGQVGITPTNSSFDTIMGVAIHAMTKEYATVGGTAFAYSQYDAVPVLRRGMCWVVVEEAVNNGDPVYCRFATSGANTVRGSFRKSSDSTTALLVNGAVYRSVAAASGLALLEINLPA